MKKLELNFNQYLEAEKIGLGVFSPLTNFMNHKEFESVVENCTLLNSNFFPVPVLLNISEKEFNTIQEGEDIELFFMGNHFANLKNCSPFMLNPENYLKKIFKTDEVAHPGVAHLLELAPYFLAGKVDFFHRVEHQFSRDELTPMETKEIIKSRGWKTVCGFQTRNAPHRAHEYLQKLSLEICDGLLIQPLVGKKKTGDFTPEAVIGSYQTLIQEYFPKDKVLLNLLSTNMRYAGPREAVFHALIRRNYGCTHFIIGRDHAGVGGYYEKYEAQDFALGIKDLGITILPFKGPFYCEICDGIVTENICSHQLTASESTLEINGTDIRNSLLNKTSINKNIFRDAVYEKLISINPIFIP